MDHSLIFSVFPVQAKRPGGAYRIASFLREHDWDVEVIEWAAEWSLEELKELATSRITSKTVFIGFSSFFSHWTKCLEEFTEWLKDRYPDIPLVLGGQSRPRMDAKSIDYFVTGYGENALLELIKKFKGTSTEPLKLDLRFLGKKVITSNHTYISYPMRSLKISYEKRDFIDPNEWLTVEYSRGCMFKCLYCNFPILGVKGDYTRDADDYVSQLQETYDEWGVTNYIAADETFNDRTDKIIKFADATERLNFEPFISAFIRADLLVSRKQDWEHLERMKIFSHYYGVESMNHASAKSIGKGMHPEKLQAGLLEAKNYFKRNDGRYRGHISLIAGLPHETEETLEKTISWCENNWQGEGSEIWPLEIPLNDTLDVPSLLTSKWKEYGYRAVSETPFVLDLDSSSMDSGDSGFQSHGIFNLDWENDYMNFRRAKDLCDIYNNRLRKSGSGVGSFFLQELSYSLPLDEILKLRFDVSYRDKGPYYWFEDSYKKIRSKIKDYIQKKLSL